MKPKKPQPIVYAGLSKEDESRCADFLSPFFCLSQLLGQHIENYRDVIALSFVQNGDITNAIWRVKANTKAVTDRVMSDLNDESIEKIYGEGSALWNEHLAPIIEAFRKASEDAKNKEGQDEN